MIGRGKTEGPCRICGEPFDQHLEAMLNKIVDDNEGIAAVRQRGSTGVRRYSRNSIKLDNKSGLASSDSGDNSELALG